MRRKFNVDNTSTGILREIFLTSDIVARIGGDGFEVVSIETPRENIHV